MSIYLDPTIYTYSTPPNVCTDCYDIGKTPLKMFVGVSGVELGPAHAPPDPPPPNGVFELTITAPCTWSLNDGTWIFFYQPGLVLSNFQITTVAPVNAFVQSENKVCHYLFDNEIPGGGARHYLGGFAICVPALPGGVWDEGDWLDLLDANPYSEVYSRPRPSDPTHCVHCLSRPVDNTNLKVKIEHP